MKKAGNAGFTLIEIMVVIAITAILLLIGIPSMRAMAERNAVAGHVNALVGSITLARAEAIKRNTPVVICRSTNAETADPPTCASSGTGWQSGWIVFMERSGTGTQYQPSQGDVLLRVQGALTDSGGIEQNKFIKLQFRSTGLLSTGNSQFTFNSASLTSNQQRRVCVAMTGRARLIDNDTDLCQ
ncbi:GspH/FimT family pseudopilin [Diaphorobacter sp. LR2014-1]|uniref:GspH/FimT family pseudopilin n=1 Tax=Diaphorobacter sp. LR2014-1 TaxID=1933219 RepID=UPI000CDAFCAE|nr:GspH/FimT family pseudopilin [Diaphorobacter sp. LR2014-1]POR11794.1 hypothetical protein BV908_05750 [Diaphorobacter sp. LR2014-1]